jgi:hypothetical protein
MLADTMEALQPNEIRLLRFTYGLVRIILSKLPRIVLTEAG